MKKGTISKEEIIKIEEEARIADIFLRDPEFQFIINYIKESLSSIETAILNDSFNDVTERVTLTPNTGRDILITAEKQKTEAIGVRKWLKQFIVDMERFVQLKGEMDKELMSGRLHVEGGPHVKDISESAG